MVLFPLLTDYERVSSIHPSDIAIFYKVANVLFLGIFSTFATDYATNRTHSRFVPLPCGTAYVIENLDGAIRCCRLDFRRGEIHPRQEDSRQEESCGT